MVFKPELPELADLCRITRSVKSYPTSTDTIAEVARDLGYGSNVIEFINLFPHGRGDKFESRADFYTRAAELAMFICEERISPKEELRSPQNEGD